MYTAVRWDALDLSVLSAWQRHARLSLIFAVAVAVGCLAHVVGIGLQEQHLRYTLVRVDACG